ncbi:MAG TPA: FkbM family methyltransferase [Terriglobales bacterium]|nr:FkbM family methyltransferase [Terriglobales bacterium]
MDSVQQIFRSPGDRVRAAFAPLHYLPLLEWPKFLAYKRGLGKGEAVFHVKGLAGGLRCRAGTTDAVTIQSTFEGLYHLPPRTLNRCAVILDLGANAGYVAAHLATLYPAARVIAVEMDAANTRLARLNLSPFSGVEVVQAAIWVEDGMVCYSGRAADAFAVSRGGHHVAKAVTIERLLDHYQIAAADYVKMDIEGAEWELFQHPGWLERVSSINIEIHRPEWSTHVADILTRFGFLAQPGNRHWSRITGFRPDVYERESDAADVSKQRAGCVQSGF